MSDVSDSFGRDFRWWAMKAAKLEARVEQYESTLEIAQTANAHLLPENQRLEAELRDTKDTIEAVKHSNRSLEAEVENLTEDLTTARRQADYNIERAEKAEAEVEKLREHGITYVSETLEREVGLEAEVEKLRLAYEALNDEATQRMADAKKAEAERDDAKVALALGNERHRLAMDRAEAGRGRLAEALREIQACVGSSTEAWHIARAALDAFLKDPA